MVRRVVAVVLGAVLGVGVGVAPAWADHGTAHTIAQMTAHYQDPGLEAQNKPFALLYLRTTEGMRDANLEGEFSAPEFWDREVIPTFADYYLDAYADWRRHRMREVDPAWRIAFRAMPERLNCTQLIYLGISAHINNDLAFMIEDMGPRYTYADHKHVDDVLVFRTRPVVYPEIQRDLCPGLFGEVVPPTADVDIFAWREAAWRNGQALLAAPDRRARDALARRIRADARDKAREIVRWYR
ncbi:hypothetical protein Asi02nite_64850 [Asanoa siamensis]|uniref:Uncharacterized protein n=2 Tax=Asanoa siamensis TaxID=926357 RepID=A0ABQ4D098_9ACTN|nr:hypothetical protein Asi02nite_64850 [Asanoa siamensis]